MICYNCNRFFPLEEIAVFNLQDQDENVIKKVCICQSCAKKLIIAIMNTYEGDQYKNRI